MCDKKDGNVLLERMSQNSPILRAILTDFGISRILNAQNLPVKYFRTININGVSARYAAPEALMAFRRSRLQITEPQELKSVDVYAFSVLIWATLTRKVPWSRKV